MNLVFVNFNKNIFKCLMFIFKRLMIHVCYLCELGQKWVFAISSYSYKCWKLLIINIMSTTKIQIIFIKPLLSKQFESNIVTNSTMCSSWPLDTDNGVVDNYDDGDGSVCVDYEGDFTIMVILMKMLHTLQNASLEKRTLCHVWSLRETYYSQFDKLPDTKRLVVVALLLNDWSQLQSVS